MMSPIVSHTQCVSLWRIIFGTFSPLSKRDAYDPDTMLPHWKSTMNTQDKEKGRIPHPTMVETGLRQITTLRVVSQLNLDIHVVK